MLNKHRKSQPSRVSRLPSLNCGWGQLNITQSLVTSERLMIGDKLALWENGNSPVQPTVETERSEEPWENAETQLCLPGHPGWQS